MNTIKALGLAGLATTALFASQAFATACPVAPATGIQTQGGPVCIAPTGKDGTGLQDNLNSITTGGPRIDVYNDQVTPSSYWAISSSGVSANKIVLELGSYANRNMFGIFDPSNTSNTLQLFKGEATTGWTTTLTEIGNTFTATYFNATGGYEGQSSMTLSGSVDAFGYYLGRPQGSVYSDPSLNAAGGSTYPNGMPHMVTYAGNDATTLNFGGHEGTFSSGEYIMAWDDLLWPNSDLDYNDFVVMVESVHPVNLPSDPTVSVPEPATLGMFGFGTLLIGLATMGLRRRRADEV